jgi:hypothetical protein
VGLVLGWMGRQAGMARIACACACACRRTHAPALLPCHATSICIAIAFACPQPDAPKNPRAVAEALLANLGETEGMVAETSLAGGGRATVQAECAAGGNGGLVAAGWLAAGAGWKASHAAGVCDRPTCTRTKLIMPPC